MNTPKSRMKGSTVTVILGVIVSTFAIIGMCWGTIVVPQVDKRIDGKLAAHVNDSKDVNREVLAKLDDINTRLSRIEGKLSK